MKVLNFFERVAFLTSQGLLDKTTVEMRWIQVLETFPGDDDVQRLFHTWRCLFEKFDSWTHLEQLVKDITKSNDPFPHHGFPQDPAADKAELETPSRDSQQVQEASDDPLVDWQTTAEAATEGERASGRPWWRRLFGGGALVGIVTLLLLPFLTRFIGPRILGTRKKERS